MNPPRDEGPPAAVPPGAATATVVPDPGDDAGEALSAPGDEALAGDAASPQHAAGHGSGDVAGQAPAVEPSEPVENLGESAQDLTSSPAAQAAAMVDQEDGPSATTAVPEPGPRSLPTRDLGEVPTEEPPPPATAHAVVLAVTNQKGGVGKTTTTVSLGAALAAEGHDVLVVDLDPQGNATTGLGLRVSQGAPSTYRVIVEQLPVEDAAEPTAVRKLHIVPSSLDLAGAEIELVPAFSREHRLRTALEAVRDQYDVVLIDCPPSLGLLTVNAMVAADQVLVPIQCEYYALEGLGQLMRTIEMVRTGLNPALRLGGVLMTMYDGRTNLSQQVVDEVRGHFGELAFSTVIPRTVRLSEAPSYGQPITEFDPSSRGARAYERFARELARRLGLDEDGDEPVSALDALLGPATPRGGRDDEPSSSLTSDDTSGSTPDDVGDPGPTHAGDETESPVTTDPDAFEQRTSSPTEARDAQDDSMFHVDPSSTRSQPQEGSTWQR